MTPCSLADGYLHFQIQVLKFLKLEPKNVRGKQIIKMNSVMWKIIWPHFIPKTKQDNSQAFYLWFSIWTLPSAYTKTDTHFSLELTLWGQLKH